MRPILPNPDYFVIRDCQIAGDDCVLIFPKSHAGVEWNNQNKIFRSSIWRKRDMLPISLGFRKFTNYGEKPEFEPLKMNDDMSFIRKMDGSLLIISQYNGAPIIRTRGTIDARMLDNGHEIDYLISKYPHVFKNSWLGSERYSILCEWTTPNNKIVYSESDEPSLWLIGIVDHTNYSYESQFYLNELSIKWNISRPQSYPFNTFDEMKDAVEKFEDTEGVVIYSNHGQTLKKIKALKYLYLQRILAGLENEENVIDLFLSLDCPSYDNFYSYFVTNFDYEIAESLRGQISRTVDTWKKCDRLINEMGDRVTLIRRLTTRKEQAERILNSWGDTNRAFFAFKMLDNKPLSNEDKKKLIFQLMKK